ncbi:MAG: hypothetical protein LBE12_12125 [Planctomycetaceae bacterium]|nr:hypothetical protein [Planctomycetaceae bacterium]
MRNYCRLSSNPLATLSTINSPLSTINNLVPAGLRKHKRLTKCRENRTKKIIPLIYYKKSFKLSIFQIFQQLVESQ